MVIDIIKMKQEGRLSEDFHFDYNPDANLILSLPNATFAGPVKVDVQVDIEGSDVFAGIVLSYTIQGECSRCLENAHKTIDYQFDAKFSLYPKEDEYLYKSGKVELDGCINEAIMLSQPSVIYCKEDCKGLCPVCGANLNITDCGHIK